MDGQILSRRETRYVIYIYIYSRIFIRVLFIFLYSNQASQLFCILYCSAHTNLNFQHNVPTCQTYGMRTFTELEQARAQRRPQHGLQLFSTIGSVPFWLALLARTNIASVLRVITISGMPAAITHFMYCQIAPPRACETSQRCDFFGNENIYIILRFQENIQLCFFQLWFFFFLNK